MRIKTATPEEQSGIQSALKAQGIPSENPTNADSSCDPAHLNISLKDTDEAYFLMLGSQPTPDSIRDYVSRLKEAAKEKTVEATSAGREPTNIVFFPICGKDTANEDALFSQLITQIQKAVSDGDWPENFKLMPLGPQDGEEIHSLLQRCDSITRSGGITMFELLAMRHYEETTSDKPNRKRYIHSEARGEQDKSNGMPIWEYGNALFLEDQIGAEIITPQEMLKKESAG